jgi:hypothetical protein
MSSNQNKRGKNSNFPTFKWSTLNSELLTSLDGDAKRLLRRLYSNQPLTCLFLPLPFPTGCQTPMAVASSRLTSSNPAAKPTPTPKKRKKSLRDQIMKKYSEAAPWSPVVFYHQSALKIPSFWSRRGPTNRGPPSPQHTHTQSSRSFLVSSQPKILPPWFNNRSNSSSNSWLNNAATTT